MQFDRLLLLTLWLTCLAVSTGRAQSTWFTRIDITEWEEFSNEMIQAPDGGWLLAGTAEKNVHSSGTDKDIVIVKLDSEGQVQWTQRLDVFREGVSWTDIHPHVLYEADGSILVVASSHKNTNGFASKVVFWRLSSDGTVLSHLFSVPQLVKSVIRAASGDIITAGESLRCVNDSCWDLKSLQVFNAQLEHQAEITGFASQSFSTQVFELAEMDQVGFTFLSDVWFRDTNDITHAWITLDSYDPEEQEYEHATLHNVVGNAFSNEHLVQIDSQHVIAGYQVLNYDYWIEKRNIVTNQVIWKRSLGEDLGFIKDIAATPDGGLLFASIFQQKNISLIKVDEDANVQWQQILPILFPLNPDTPINNSHTNEITAIRNTADGGFILFGQYKSDNAIGMHELFVVKLDHLGGFGNFVDGFLKIDSDDNCLVDSTDRGLEGWIVEARNQQLRYVTTTDSAGYYAMQLPLGEFEISFLNARQPYWTLCPQTNIIQIVSQGDSIRLDQPVGRSVHCPLMDIDIASGWINICDQAHVAIKYCNEGTVTGDDVSISVVLDDEMTLVYSSAPYTQHGDTILYQPGDVDFNDCGDIRMIVFISCDAQADSFCVETSIMPDQYCLSGNPPQGIQFADVACREAGRPFDPNNKLAWPVGAGPLHKVHRDSILSYQINFQNTGTDTAVHVVLRDTLSPLVDLSTFQAGGSSHPYQWELLGNGILKFTLANIYLPDSNANAFASQGFVTYQVKPMVGIDFGSRVDNSASIYFDYESPIMTNAVFHTIAKPVHEGLFQDTVCSGEIFEGVVILADTLLADTLYLADYDSITYIAVVALPEILNSVQASICPGESYVYEGNSYSTEGIFTITYIASNGCDSLVELSLQVVDTSQIALQIDLCVGDVSPITLIPYDIPGVYLEQFSGTSVNGCDSNVLLTIRVYPNEEIFIEKELPLGTIYHGVTLTQDTTFIIHGLTKAGCLLTTYEHILVTPTSTLDDRDAIIRVFPNPFNDEIQLELDVTATGDFSFQLSDMQGRIVMHLGDESLPSGHAVLHYPVVGLAPGVFMLQIQSGSKTRQFRMVKL